MRRFLALALAALVAAAPPIAAGQGMRQIPEILLTQPPTPRQAVVPRTTNALAINGSSSSAGNNDGSGESLATAIRAAMPGSSQAVLSEAAGGATDSSVTTQVTGTTNTSASRIVQTDLNTTFLNNTNVGSPEQRRNWLKNTIIPLLNASVVSQGRLLAWHGTEYTWGGLPLWREYRMNRLMWADMPGKVVLTHRYWMMAPPNGPLDQAAITAGEIPPTYQISASNRSHLNWRGDRYMARMWAIPFAASVEGGLPFFPYHRYFSNRSTAQTNGGTVVQLAFSGSLTGTTLQLIDPDGLPSRHFKVDASGLVTRASSTVLKNGYYDLRVRSRKGALTRDDPIAIGIGSLNLCACDEMFLDGNVDASIDSIDNAGTLDSPSYTNGTSRDWRGVPGGQTEMSFWVRLQPDAASDGQLLNIWYQGNGVRIQRLASGAISVSVRGDDGTTISSSLDGGNTCGTGAITSSCGRRWVLYSVNVASGVSRQRLIVLDDATNTVVRDSGVVAVTGTKTSVTPNPIATGITNYIFGSPTGARYRGLVARMGFALKEIDWSVSGNRDALRAGANSLVSFATNGPADGRSFVVTGTGSYFNGTITPFFALSGNAGDFHEGINAGTAFGLGGEAPGNTPLAGGISYETWDRRDWRNLTSTQGLAVTQ